MPPRSQPSAPPPGAPLELISHNSKNGRFEVGQAALAALRAVRGPVGVVAVAGRARQGKSFILNQLLSTSSGGFVVGPTHRPCTKGLWMWSSPQQRTGSDGNDHHLVLLDTEGIDAYDQTAQYSTQIFSLAVLLSSLFVYNQMGGIDESALDRLSLVTEMTKHIRVRAGAGSDQELGEYAPAFLWLLRDFYLKLEEDGGRKISARDYLETALQPVSGSGSSVEAKNAIRASIRSLFPDRDCATLVRPVNDEAALAALDHIPREQLRPEFRDGVNRLITFIFNKAQPKRFGSQVVTGPVLAGLVEAYVAAINDGAVPTIATAWQGVAESESRRAADGAESAYLSSFNQQVPAEEVALEAEHQRCLAIARETFNEVAVGDARIRAAHEARFLATVQRAFGELKGRRLAEAAAAVNELLYNASKSVAAALRAGGTLEQLQAQLAATIDQFAKSAVGPTKWQRLAEFLRDTYPAVAAELLQRAEAQAAKRVESAQREAIDAKTSAASWQQRAEQAERQHQQSSTTSQAQAAQLAALHTECGTLRAQLEQRSAKVSALEAQLRESFSTSERKNAAAGEAAEARVRAVEAAAAVRVAEAAAAVNAERNKVNDLTADLAAANARLRGLQAEAASLGQEGNGWREKYSAVQQEVIGLQRQRDEAASLAVHMKAERDAAANAREEARAQAAHLQAQLDQAQQERAAADARADQHYAEAAAARAAAVAGTSNSYQQANGAAAVPMDTAPAHGGSSLGADEMAKMTVSEIKDWLTQAGHADVVWSTANARPAPKKADWLELLRKYS